MDVQMDSETTMDNLEIKDVMSFDNSKANSLLRNRFIKYTNLAKEIGETAAFEELVEKYPETQQLLVGLFSDGNTLAKEFRKKIPLLQSVGFATEIVDVSQAGQDAALEIQRACPALSLAKEYGLETPCRVLCEMEQEAVIRAYSNIKASVMSKITAGDCVCIFKYERPAQTALEAASKEPNAFMQAIQLLKISPILMRIGIKILKKRLSN